MRGVRPKRVTERDDANGLIAVCRQLQLPVEKVWLIKLGLWEDQVPSICDVTGQGNPTLLGLAQM